MLHFHFLPLDGIKLFPKAETYFLPTCSGVTAQQPVEKWLFGGDVFFFFNA